MIDRQARVGVAGVSQAGGLAADRVADADGLHINGDCAVDRIDLRHIAVRVEAGRIRVRGFTGAARLSFRRVAVGVGAVIHGAVVGGHPGPAFVGCDPFIAGNAQPVVIVFLADLIQRIGFAGMNLADDLTIHGR